MRDKTAEMPYNPGMRSKRNRKLQVAALLAAAPVSHGMLLAGLAVMVLYFSLRRSRAVMQAVWDGFVRPFHRAAGRLCAQVPFSVAEAIDVLLALLLAAWLIRLIVRLVRCRPGDRGRLLYRAAAFLLAVLVVIYAGYCLLWGCGYYTPGLAERMGMDVPGVSAEALEETTAYFAACADYYGALVPRDEDGVFCADRAQLLTAAPEYCRRLSEQEPALSGACFPPKPVYFSRVMSAVNFTGFFFPFTGEANVNMDSPACMLPSTAAHELAHQLGVTAESEANFAAVLACMESGDPVYAYSGSLLAYIHLSNALYRVQPERWRAIRADLSAQVQADLADNSAYWQRYDTTISAASSTVYAGFLESYGQTQGLQSYGACVDLLVYWYGGAAATKG